MNEDEKILLKKGQHIDTFREETHEKIKEFVKFNMDKFSYCPQNDTIIYDGEDIEL